MTKSRSLGLMFLLLASFTIGCSHGPKGGRGGEEHLRASLALLEEADRKLAEAQRWCPVTNENRLGETGVPVKVMVEGRPVFLCCKTCVRAAQKHPERTLGYVRELKAKAAANPKG
jgi:hypothetical protein